MKVGVPREAKPFEYRVAIVPDGVEQLVARGHQVMVQAGAGRDSGIDDDDYRTAGASIVPDAAAVYGLADMIMKVKEPQPAEYPLLRKGQILYAFFHFAASRGLAEAVMRAGCVAIAWETMRSPDRRLPILTPMSEVAGKMSVQEGAKYLEQPMMGRGILLGGVPGVEPAEVVVVGGGTVGSNAAGIAAGMGARVTILDINLDRLRYLDEVMPRNVATLFCNAHNLRRKLRTADLAIGAVLVEGARAPVVVTVEMVMSMKRGSVIVDVAIDQGGCVATSRPTTHGEPTYVVHDVIHYCVANMPGAVAHTSTFALANVTIGPAVAIADKGWRRAAADSPLILTGLNICTGRVTNRAVAETFGLEFVDPAAALSETPNV